FPVGRPFADDHRAAPLAGVSLQMTYARRDACPACGAPASAAVRVMASEPPAESLPAEKHGEFMSGYGARRVFFSYHRCPQCALLYCPVYYSAAQLSQLYGHQAENMAEVPLASRLRTQEHYVEL